MPYVVTGDGDSPPSTLYPFNFHNHCTQTALPTPRTRMDDISQLDGSDAAPGASAQVQFVSALKEHLKNALLIVDALDQSSFSNLSTDREYKDSVQRLLSPLTTLSLSTIVDQANEVLRSGLGAISARMLAIIDSPNLSTAAPGPCAASRQTHPHPRPPTRILFPTPQGGRLWLQHCLRRCLALNFPPWPHFRTNPAKRRI